MKTLSKVAGLDGEDRSFPLFLCCLLAAALIALVSRGGIPDGQSSYLAGRDVLRMGYPPSLQP